MQECINAVELILVETSLEQKQLLISEVFELLVRLNNVIFKS